LLVVVVVVVVLLLLLLLLLLLVAAIIPEYWYCLRQSQRNSSIEEGPCEPATRKTLDARYQSLAEEGSCCTTVVVVAVVGIVIRDVAVVVDTQSPNGSHSRTQSMAASVSTEWRSVIDFEILTKNWRPRLMLWIDQ
jgi:hypothetical protein